MDRRSALICSLRTRCASFSFDVAISEFWDFKEFLGIPDNS
jgi:hypothetical protein